MSSPDRVLRSNQSNRQHEYILLSSPNNQQNANSENTAEFQDSEMAHRSDNRSGQSNFKRQPKQTHKIRFSEQTETSQQSEEYRNSNVEDFDLNVNQYKVMPSDRATASSKSNRQAPKIKGKVVQPILKNSPKNIITQHFNSLSIGDQAEHYGKQN